MKLSKVSVVEMTFSINHPVEKSLYDYIVSAE